MRLASAGAATAAGRTGNVGTAGADNGALSVDAAVVVAGVGMDAGTAATGRSVKDGKAGAVTAPSTAVTVAAAVAKADVSIGRVIVVDAGVETGAVAEVDWCASAAGRTGKDGNMGAVTAVSMEGVDEDVDEEDTIEVKVGVEVAGVGVAADGW
jgi:hypothetical protein